MLTHTMIVSFADQIPDAELDQFLQEMETLMLDSGPAQTFSARRHIPVPEDAHAPVFIATAIVQLTFADGAALSASFTVPGVEDLIGRWQSRHPYKVVWVNHEPLS